MKHNWEYRRLGDVCSIYQPKTISTKDFIENGEYDVFGANGIIGRYNKYNHEYPEVLLTCRGATCGTINISNPKSWINGNAMVVHPIKDELSLGFLREALRTLDYSTIITGAAQPQITRQSLLPVSIPVPPMEVQQQIVAELDQINDLIAKNRELLSQLDALAQSIFYDTFGDPISNPKGWDVSKIGAISSVQTGATPSREIEANFCGEIPWVKTTEVQNCNILNTAENISEDAMENSNCKIFPIDTILVAMYGQGKTRGQIARLKIEACTNQACAAILPSTTLHPSFLFSFLLASYEPLRSVAVGCNQKNLNLSLIKNYPIFLPPLALQEDFAAKVEAIEAQKAKVEAEIAELQTLLDARMDYWFN